LRKYQKGIYYLGTKVYNNLPPHIKWSQEIWGTIETIFTTTFFLLITGIFPL
jgi:hypothetical protein